VRILLSESWHNVFAYGSNMHLPDMARWMRERGLGEPVIRAAEPAVLREHALVWNYRSKTRGGGAANIAPTEGAAIYGVLLEMDANTFAALDRKEGHPGRYSRGDQPRTLWLSERREEALGWVYEVTPSWRLSGPIWPRPSYLKLMVEAAQHHRLPSAWIDTLAAIPTTRA